MSMPKANIDNKALTVVMTEYQKNKGKRFSRRMTEEEYGKLTGYFYSWCTLYRYWRAMNNAKTI